MKLLILSLLGGGLVVGGIYYYKRQVDLLNQMQIDFLGVDGVGVGGNYTTGTAKFKLSNHSLIEGSLNNVNLDVYLNSQYLGNVYQKSSLIIPANGYNNIAVDFKLSTGPLLANAGNIVASYFGGTDTTMNFNFKGSVGISSGILFINVPIEEQYATKLSQLI